MNREEIFRHFKRFEPHLVLFILCFIVARVGLSIVPLGSALPLVWPATAIAFSAVVVYGYKLWWPALLAFFTAYTLSGAGIGFALSIAIGTTLEVLIGAYFLRNVIGFNSNLVRLRDNVVILIAAFFCSLVGSAIGMMGVWFFGGIPPEGLIPLWTSWWSGDATGMFIIAPLLLKWFPQPFFKRTDGQYMELILAIGAVLATSIFVFWRHDTQFAYYIFIPLTWAALRTGPRGITLAIFITGTTAMWGTLLERGPYAQFDIFQLELFLGTLSALFLIFTSVVEERKNAEQELGQHVEELEQALSKISSEDEAKKNFLAILAHELRNPLAAMLSSIELLRLQKTDEMERSGLVRTIGEHVTAMRSMLDDVLDISRISRNKLALRKEIVSLDSLLDHSVESTRAIIRDRHHKLSITKPSSPLFVEVDPVRIEQIVVNLLNNAAKYTNLGGLLEVSISADHGMAVMRFKDNGVGISKAMQKRIFEPFFQVRRGKLATEGLGVGLPLTKQLVEMHDGTIEAKSAGEGKGSEFIVRLPLANEQKQKTVKLSTPSKNRRLRFVKHKRSILVVDDNEAAANALGRLLELRGHEVSVAYNGLSGVDAARQKHPDLLILDIGLPDIDGYEVVRRLQEDTKVRSAIIALTGYGQLEDKERALKAGFHHHLTKPVGLKELERVFKKVAHVYEESD